MVTSGDHVFDSARCVLRSLHHWTSRTLKRALTLNYATDRPRLRWFSALSIASALLLWHFLVSCGMWGSYLVGLARNPDMRDQLPVTLTADASLLATLALLLALSVTSFVAAIRRHRFARLLLLITLGASIASFAYDTTRRRYQDHVFIATKDYWDAGGKRYDYFTWWWYNDRRFHRQSRRSPDAETPHSGQRSGVARRS